MADEDQNIVLQGTKQELMQLIPQMMAMYQLFEKNNDRGLYTIPVTTFQDAWTFYPQIKLVFYQLSDEVTNGNPRVTGEITYRIMGETSETFTPNNAEVRAQRIKALFTEPELFVWQKGKEMFTYKDQQDGYNFQLLAKNELEARKIITRVIEIESKQPDWNNLVIHKSKKDFPNIPATKRIYGEQRRMPRRRPLEDIKFRYAELHLWGRPKPVTLVDTLGNRNTPLVRVL